MCCASELRTFRGPVECWLQLCWDIIVAFNEPNFAPDFSLIHIHQLYSYLFSNIPDFDSQRPVSKRYHSSFILRRLNCKSPSEMSRFYSRAQTSASNHTSSSPYQGPSLLIQHASVVAFSHECPGNPPHLLFKSMQITTSESSRASSETELCTCGDWTSEGRRGGAPLHFSPRPRPCLCRAPLQKISHVLLSWFNLASFGDVKQAGDIEGGKVPGIWKDKILCLWSRGWLSAGGLESMWGEGWSVWQLNLGAERMKDKCRVTRADWHYARILHE